MERPNEAIGRPIKDLERYRFEQGGQPPSWEYVEGLYDYIDKLEKEVCTQLRKLYGPAHIPGCSWHLAQHQYAAFRAEEIIAEMKAKGLPG